MAARWALVVGRKGTGKSSLCRRVAAALAARGARVGGVVQDPVAAEGGERAGYRLARLRAGDEAVSLARKGDEARTAAEESFCSFVFDVTAFERARAWIVEDAAGADVVFVDEVSKMEAAGRGHHDGVVAALASPALVVLSVRADQLAAVLERFALDEPVASVDTEEPAEAAEAFAAALWPARA